MRQVRRPVQGVQTRVRFEHPRKAIANRRLVRHCLTNIHRAKETLHVEYTAHFFLSLNQFRGRYWEESPSWGWFVERNPEKAHSAQSHDFSGVVNALFERGFSVGVASVSEALSASSLMIISAFTGQFSPGPFVAWPRLMRHCQHRSTLEMTGNRPREVWLA
jgi:hypothetical protein